VKAADTSASQYRGRQSGTTYSAADLVQFGGGSYFWRVDEVEADGTTIHKGNVWGFTVPDYLIADEFEGYTDDEGSRIYETWIDGWTNGTGSVVGNLQAPFAERGIVHGGLQSMPLDYNNIKSPYYSEAEREFSPLQNWTTNGVDSLELYVRGVATNAAGRLYVVVEDSAGKTAEAANLDTSVTKSTTWTQWKIPLGSLTGVNLAKIKKMYIGVGDRKNPVAGGFGRLYIDDIRVTQP